MPVISASRRTDIPAFYAEWFINRLRAGFCHWINPYSKQVYRVSLAPEDCTAIVFWTRNPRPLLRHLPELDANGYKYYFLYTITGYPRVIESHRPDLDAAIRTFQVLADRLSPEHVIWRYDPIVMSDITTDQYHMDRFRYIAERLQGYTHECTYSFISMYGKTKRNLDAVSAQTGITFTTPEREARHALLRNLVDIARANKMQMLSCCMEDYLHVEGIQQSTCVGLSRLQNVTGNRDLFLKAKPTREHCGCVASVDIGSYETCLFGCAYCYATNSRQIALQNHAIHNPCDSILLRPKQLSGVDLDTLVKAAVST
jgi:hypothetical protein